MSKADDNVRSVKVEEYSVFTLWLDFRVGLTRIDLQHQMDGFLTEFIYNETDLSCLGSHVAQLLAYHACIGYDTCMAVVMCSSWLHPQQTLYHFCLSAPF